jgi:hypothetical protein
LAPLDEHLQRFCVLLQQWVFARTEHVEQEHGVAEQHEAGAEPDLKIEKVFVKFSNLK